MEAREMGKTPESKVLAPVGNVIERERKLTWYEVKDDQGKSHKEGFRSISLLARAIGTTHAHLWRIIYGQRGVGETINIQRMALLLAHEQVKASTCPPGDMLNRATDIEQRIRLVLQPPPPSLNA